MINYTKLYMPILFPMMKKNKLCSYYLISRGSKIVAKHQDIPKIPKTISQAEAIGLEQLALVDFRSMEAIKCLEGAIAFADKLMEVDTSGVEPLITTVYSRNEHLRSDEVTETSRREELIKLAPVLEEKYYISPPSNAALSHDLK